MNQVRYELSHSGVLGMKWGHHKATTDKTPSARSLRNQAIKDNREGDKAWGKKKNQRALIKEANDKVNADPTFQKDLQSTFKVLQRVTRNQTELYNSYQASAAALIDSRWERDSSMHNPSNTKRLSMQTININGEVYMTPKVVRVKGTGVQHSDIDGENTDDIEEFEVYYKIDSEGNFEEIDPSSLAHYGIPGMKWGVHRSGASSTSSKIKKGPPSDDYKRMQEMKKRGTKNLTTAELKELTGRMQLEKQYKDLSKASVSKGRAYVSDLFKTTGKEIAKETLKNAAKKGLENSAKYVADLMTDIGKAY